MKAKLHKPKSKTCQVCIQVFLRPNSARLREKQWQRSESTLISKHNKKPNPNDKTDWIKRKFVFFHSKFPIVTHKITANTQKASVIVKNIFENVCLGLIF